MEQILPQPPEGSNTANTLLLDVWPPDLYGMHFCWFKPTSLLQFVLAALRNELPCTSCFSTSQYPLYTFVSVAYLLLSRCASAGRLNREQIEKELQEIGSDLTAIGQASFKLVDSITQARVLKISFLGKVRGSTHSHWKTIVPVAFCKEKTQAIETIHKT